MFKLNIYKSAHRRSKHFQIYRAGIEVYGRIELIYKLAFYIDCVGKCKYKY